MKCQIKKINNNNNFSKKGMLLVILKDLVLQMLMQENKI